MIFFIGYGIGMLNVKTYAHMGLQGYEVVIEADSSRTLPTIDIIGLPDATIKEAKERLRSTFRHLMLELPPRKIVLNLAPSDLKKMGSGFDLPMAVAMLFLLDGDFVHQEFLETSLFFGELGLDGKIKHVKGLLPRVLQAYKAGYKTFFVPQDNLNELHIIPDIVLYPLGHFRQLVDFFSGKCSLSSVSGGFSPDVISPPSRIGFEHIKGHLFAKRALAIAAAGFHNVLMIGSPGTGKTLLSKALKNILPPLHFNEMLEVSQIYSVAGKLSQEQPLIVDRPFRHIHHTASKVALVGGTSSLLPGEISLAHKGVLFCDEIAEFPREVLEVLRQPLEDRKICLSRAQGVAEYPAECMIVAAMNPCPCGYYQDPHKPCTCSMVDIKKYQQKISGPLLDRFDMILEIPRESSSVLLEDSVENLDGPNFQQRVLDAWEVQTKRYQNTYPNNALLDLHGLQKFVVLGQDVKDFVHQVADRFHLSPRVIHRTLKLARTIADMEGVEDVGLAHVAEAFQYRSKNLLVGHEL